MLSVYGAQNALSFGNFQDADTSVAVDRLKGQLLIARDDDGSGYRRQIPRLPALLVVLHELVDLPANDLALIGLFIRGDTAFQQVPVDLRRRPPALAPPDRRLGLLAVAQHLEADELVDVTGGEGGLVELDSELLHLDGGDVNHKKREFYRVSVNLYNRFTVS